VETADNATIMLRFRKQTLEDGVVVQEGYHRTCIEPGMPVAAQMAMVHQHLAQLGYPEVSPGALGQIQAAVAREHTPPKVKKFQDDLDERARGRP
jgi:hypothetical protein